MPLHHTNYNYLGYLNNITSDRRLIAYCNDSLAIRLYLRYDIDESLPWHSTISCKRQLYSEEVFHHDLYMKNHEKRTKNELYATHMSRLRSATVEPVLGENITLLER